MSIGNMSVGEVCEGCRTRPPTALVLFSFGIGIAMALATATLAWTWPRRAAAAEAYVPSGDARFDGSRHGAVQAKPWWKNLGDEQLETLINTGLEDSHDIRATRARVEQAQALTRQELARLLPSLSLVASGRVEPFEGLTFQYSAMGSGSMPGSAAGGASGASNDLAYSGSGVLSLRVPLDIWGRQWLAYQAADNSSQASEAERQALAASLAAQVALAYYDAVAAGQQLDLLNAQLSANRDLLEVIELRYQGGSGSGLDVLQQRQQVAASEARMPPARTAQRLALQRLAVLIGQTDLRALPRVASKMPKLSDPPTHGLPVDLLDNRPDLRAARMRLKSAQEQASAAYRYHLPALSLSGDVGYQGLKMNETDVQDTWSALVSLSIPLFSGGGDTAAVNQAAAAERAAAEDMSKAVLQAVADVEGALVHDRESREELLAYERQVTAARAAFDKSKERYTSGVETYVTVLTALNALQQAELAWLQAQLGTLSARIGLYNALGGPWTQQL